MNEEIYHRWLQEDKLGAVIEFEMQGKAHLTRRGIYSICHQHCWVWYPHTTSNCCGGSLDVCEETAAFDPVI